MAAAPVPLETAPLSLAEGIKKLRDKKISDKDIITHLSSPEDYDKLTKSGLTESQILTHLTGTPGGDIPETPAPISDEEVKAKKLGPDSIFNRNRTIEKIKNTNPDDVINFLRPVLDNLAGAGAATVSLPAAPATLGVAPVAAYGLGFTGTDLLLQKMLKNPEQGLASRAAGFEPGGILSDLTNTAELGAGGKVLDTAIPKVARALSNAYKEYTAPGSIVGDTARKFQKTLSQYYDKPRYSKWIEDVFGPYTKGLRQDESAQIGKNIMTGGKEFKPQAAYDDATASMRSASQQMQSASRFNGDISAAHAETNPKEIWRPLSLGQGHVVNVPEEIAGRVDVDSAVGAARQYLKDEIENPLPGVTLTDEQAKLGKIAQNLINKASVIDPATGKAANILSFRDAWDFKQAAAEIGGLKSSGYSDPTLPSSTRKYFNNFVEALNDGISDSIPKWQNGAVEAKEAWETSKAIAGQRQALLNNKDGQIRTLINDTTTRMPALDALIGDKKQLQNVITAGEYKFPGGGRVYTTTKADLKGYQLQRMIDDAWVKDPVVAGAGRLNGQGWKNAWENADFKESRDILWNASERSNIEQTMKNFAQTQLKGPVQAANLPIYLKSKMLTIAPAFALGYLTPGGALSKAVVTGVGLTPSVLAKVFNNPKMAAVLRAASSGQPLGASAEFVSRTLSKLATGSMLNLFTSDGKTTKVTVDADGQMNPVEE